MKNWKTFVMDSKTISSKCDEKSSMSNSDNKYS